MKNISLLGSLTRDLYPIIADKYHTNSRAGGGGGFEMPLSRLGNEQVFGYAVNLDNGNPTSVEFIAKVVDAMSQ